MDIDAEDDIGPEPGKWAQCYDVTIRQSVGRQRESPAMSWKEVFKRERFWQQMAASELGVHSRYCRVENIISISVKFYVKILTFPKFPKTFRKKTKMLTLDKKE
jgi:hypothetical protein